MFVQKGFIADYASRTEQFYDGMQKTLDSNTELILEGDTDGYFEDKVEETEQEEEDQM